MKRYILALFAMIGLGGMTAKADTSLLTTEDGWTKITTMPTATDIANNYYVIVDNSNDLMLGIAKGVHNNGKWYSLALYYQTSVLPTTSAILSKLWILQKGTYADGSFALQNVEYPARLLQTEWEKGYLMETNDVSSPNDWSKLNFVYSNNYWTIENGQYPASSNETYKGYLGPWDENNTYSNIQTGQELAGNKSDDYIGRFQIYAISRTKFKENYLAAASSSNPIDVSFIYVTNPTLDLNIDGWTRSATTLKGTASSNYCTETWHSSTDFKFYQNVESLPEGAYQVSVQARSQTNSGAVYVTVNGNTLSTSVNTATSSSSMQTESATMLDRTTGKITTPTISLDEGQTLTMGFMDNVENHWDVFDNFKLYYLGNDLSTYKDARDAVKSIAEAAIASNSVPDACENAIQSVVDTYGGDYTTKADYVNAQTRIQTAIDTYFTEELKSAYAAYYAFKTKVEGLMTGVDDGQPKTDFTNAISSATTDMENNATTTTAINTQKANLRSAAMTFISSVDDHQFDITFLASQVYSDWKKNDGSAAGIVQDQFLANRPSSIPSFAENFEWTASTTGDVLYQTVSNLPAGYYQVGMYAMALSTSQRDTGITTEATEGDADRSFAFAGDQRTGLPIKFATAINFDDLTTLDVNVHLSNDGDLTFGVHKDANGSNWHFAQIASIVYSNAPDLTNLKATRDALVSEAEGLLASADADFLTATQKTALQDAIDAGNDADDFDNLNTVTLTTLPNAINTAKQQIQQVKQNRTEMIAALERFENDYNLADGTDYGKVTMSADAWTTLITKVNAVSIALDDVSQASNYGTVKNELVAQLDATDTSLRLFKSYKAMVEGTQALSISDGTTYAANSYMDTDATEQTAITALNTAFVNFAGNQTDDFSVAGFLGENLDFNTLPTIHYVSRDNTYVDDIPGWEESFNEVVDNTRLTNNESGFEKVLRLRANWTDKPITLDAFKQKMLPVGKYKLTLSWNSEIVNMNNRSQYKIGNKDAVTIGEAGDKTLTYAFEVTGSAQPFDLTFGFQKTGTGDAAAQIIVDNITLTYLQTAIALKDGEDNSNTITNKIGRTFDVTLQGRTLWKDGAWNTICLPFNMTEAQVTTLLNGNGTLMELDTEAGSYEHITGLEGSTLYLNFKDATTITAGTPYIIKWESGDHLVNPTFTGVTIVNTTAGEVKSTDETVAFIGTFGPVPLPNGDKTNLFIGADNTLNWPSVDNYNVNAFRAYFKLSTFSTARQFVLNFGEDTATGIVSATLNNKEERIKNQYYDLSGRKLDGRPSRPGIYMRNGQKVIIK